MAAEDGRRAVDADGNDMPDHGPPSGGGHATIDVLPETVAGIG